MKCMILRCNMWYPSWMKSRTTLHKNLSSFGCKPYYTQNHSLMNMRLRTRYTRRTLTRTLSSRHSRCHSPLSKR